MVCGNSLSYSNKSEEVKCIFCGRADQGHIICPDGHYMCDECHNKDAMKVIENVVFTTKSDNPFEITELTMSFSGLPMLGCQHAYIAGGSLMAAIKNIDSPFSKGEQWGIINEDIQEVFKRIRKQAHGGYCGLTGVCGIAPAIGACFSVLTGSRCGKDREQRITMQAVTRVSRVITDLTGPSCCKAYVRAALKTAVDYLREGLDISLPGQHTILCMHSRKHPHGCREDRCPYYQGTS